MDEFSKESKILIVDDTRENIDVLVGILSNFNLMIAMNGKIALKIAKEQRPDLILLDVMMPEIDGFEVCRQLKMDNDINDIPIIFITAKNQLEDELKGLELGAVDFISKPISPASVKARVRTQLELKSINQKLKGKNESLEKALDELKKTQNQLILSEKMSALGQLIAGIAHEINSPIGAIKSQNDSFNRDIGDLIVEIHSLMKELPDDIIQMIQNLVLKSLDNGKFQTSSEERKIKRDLISKFEELKLENSTKKATLFSNFGDITIVNDYLPILVHKKSVEILSLIRKLVNIRKVSSIINVSINNITKIVSSLKIYSRFNENDKLVKANIIESIETVLTIYHNKMKSSVKIIKEYNFIEEIYCYFDQLIQVWTNLIHNALQAMQFKGNLNINVDRDGDYVVVKISDSGPGIPEEIRSKIFEPFFTSKPLGEGSGLGLDIVKKIVERHNGIIFFETKINEGTAFYVKIPVNLKEI